MKILCTFPGRHGDLLWALPTLRAIARSTDQPVDLLVSEKYGSLCPLIERQPYVGRAIVEPGWPVVESAPMSPRMPPVMPEGYDRYLHLGYEGWPSAPLPYEILGIAEKQLPITPSHFDLLDPWIAKPYDLPAAQIIVGWSEEWFELKLGLTEILQHRLNTPYETYRIVNVSTSPRWQAETSLHATDWVTAAAWLHSGQIFVGCCSALHVLAVGCGRDVIAVEPSSMRLHEIFWPLGKDGTRVRIVRGIDGQSTFDGRHLVEAVQARLGRTV